MLNKVAFGGLYYIHYPTVGSQKMYADHKKLNDIIITSKLSDKIKAEVCDNKKTICLLTGYSNPTADIEILSQIKPQLADQYIKKTKVDLYI